MFDAKAFIEEQVARLRRELDGPAVIAVSGGVDSTAAAALTARAVGETLLAVYVDTGLMRKGETADVGRTLKELGVRHVVVEAGGRFFAALRGIEDPEKKRVAIGNLFIRIFEEEAAKVHATFLVQGTIAPDWIESGGQLRDRIKTHHNVGGLPERLQFRLIEPFRELFKDEVREVARQLALPDEMVWRHPFPGPGLAIRVLGEVTLERLELERAADAIVVDELRSAGLMREVWQAFAVLLPVQSVGVMGDARTYGHTVAVRAVTSADGMTADWARLPEDLLERIASRITREVPGISRVMYDITSKPPATIEWE